MIEMGNLTKKKISFCITCMNRLCHLKDTLKKNIENNYLPEDVEFVLLDYNSSDHLEQWVKDEMSDHINSGILVYYRTTTPVYYHRSHSRNIAFRLSEGNILCNLDADNYLGEGFAKEMIKNFTETEGVFYTSNCSTNDVFGRVLMLREDFYAIRGYNESLEGYGFEDVDLYTRLNNRGLVQLIFYNPEYYNIIRHSKMERISNEKLMKNLYSIYISYINPYTSEIIFLYNNYECESGIFIDNKHLNIWKEIDSRNFNDQFREDQNRVTLKEELLIGRWKERENIIYLNFNESIFSFPRHCLEFNNEEKKFYKIIEQDLIVDIMLILSTSLNIISSNKLSKNKEVINKNGFGKGIVYKNFNYTNPIVLN